MARLTYQGSPCRRAGHTERYASTGSCAVCADQDSKTYYAKTRGKQLAYKFARVLPSRDAKRAYDAAYRTANPEKGKAQRAAWRQRNSGVVLASNTERKRYVKERTPMWADRDAVAFFYECRSLGCHVDHVLPLRGDTVSGLHVETNLQWLPAAVNIRKRNALWPS